MNKARMLELADAIEAAPKHQFDMQTFVGKFKIDRIGRRRRLDTHIPEKDVLPTLRELSCGTSACIAGWAVHLHPRAGTAAAHALGWYDVEDHAAAILGLTIEQSYRLFHLRMNQDKAQAATFIRRCAELGEVPYA